MVETPVLYITFARPEYASQSFAAIRSAKPKKLYFYSNKARDEKRDEVMRNQEVRSYINRIDWDCEVKIWFREQYVDVFTSIWGAIDWVFANEEQAIIIEEDVVTCSAFWHYMDTLVPKFKKNHKVWMISGDNATPEYNPGNLSYFASRFCEIYGWASWRDRWLSLDRDMILWDEFSKSQDFKSYWGSWIQRKLQFIWFQQVKKHKAFFNPWDFIFNYSMCMNKGCCVVPFVNLVSDIGVNGANHQSIETVLRIKTNDEKFDFSNEPNDLEFTSFDNPFFLKYKVKPLIYRKIRKLLHI